MKSSRDTGDKKYEGIERRDFLKYVGRGIAGLAIASSIGLGYAPSAYADTIYYGKVKDAKTPAFILGETVRSASKYPTCDENNTNYTKELAKREENFYSAITNVASSNNYGVVVEKGDPEIAGYKDITSEVVKALKEIEKN